MMMVCMYGATGLHRDMFLTEGYLQIWIDESSVIIVKNKSRSEEIARILRMGELGLYSLNPV